jgi:hypothetical protein
VKSVQKVNEHCRQADQLKVKPLIHNAAGWNIGWFAKQITTRALTQ